VKEQFVVVDLVRWTRTQTGGAQEDGFTCMRGWEAFNYLLSFSKSSVPTGRSSDALGAGLFVGFEIGDDVGDVLFAHPELMGGEHQRSVVGPMVVDEGGGDLLDESALAADGEGIAV
jgi:hypothetical protein